MPTPPARYTEQIVIMMESGMSDGVKALAEVHRISQSEVCRRAVEAGISEVEKLLACENEATMRKVSRARARIAAERVRKAREAVR